MSIFGSAPKPPKPIPQANAPVAAEAPEAPMTADTGGAAASLISTGARGLRRRASTQRTSLIGGA